MYAFPVSFDKFVKLNVFQVLVNFLQFCEVKSYTVGAVCPQFLKGFFFCFFFAFDGLVCTITDTYFLLQKGFAK